MLFLKWPLVKLCRVAVIPRGVGCMPFPEINILSFVRLISIAVPTKCSWKTGT